MQGLSNSLSAVPCPAVSGGTGEAGDYESSAWVRKLNLLTSPAVEFVMLNVKIKPMLCILRIYIKVSLQS